MNERRNVMRLAVQHPARLFPRQAEGQLTEQRHKPMLIFFHARTVAHATEICRDYQETADRLIALEVQVAKAERIPAPTLMSLRSARTALQGRAIAARAATDGALGAAAALATYVKEGLDGSAVIEPESRQLLLFAAATG